MDRTYYAQLTIKVVLPEAKNNAEAQDDIESLSYQIQDEFGAEILSSNLIVDPDDKNFLETTLCVP